MIATTQTVLDWSRLYIPDPKTRTKAVRGELIGSTVVATNLRETFIVKHAPTGTITIYVEPYKYASATNLSAASNNAKVFGWAPSTQQVTFETSAGTAQRPDQYKKVLASYEYTEELPFSYSDLELVDYVQPAVGYLNNTYEHSITFSGSGNTLETTAILNNDKEILSKAVAIIVRRSFVNESKKRGLGIRFRGPLQSIDSVAQMRSYEEETKRLENQLQTQLDSTKIGATDTSGGAIDIYDETVVTT